MEGVSQDTRDGECCLGYPQWCPEVAVSAEWGVAKVGDCAHRLRWPARTTLCHRSRIRLPGLRLDAMGRQLDIAGRTLRTDALYLRCRNRTCHFCWVVEQDVLTWGIHSPCCAVYQHDCWSFDIDCSIVRRVVFCLLSLSALSTNCSGHFTGRRRDKKNEYIRVWRSVCLYRCGSRARTLAILLADGGYQSDFDALSLPRSASLGVLIGLECTRPSGHRGRHSAQ